ncbi:MAG TPA: 16S rRNA (cytidine(1402)-2'-O)-methyltransferase [Vicinamibacterales bacterium]|nr:16S rRNA (cytidine(1402)-2'-O)-methyltransferase [Vicinamibacterales bacterium]
MALRAGTLFIVATPIGNLEDVTARALRVLREVQLIAAEDTRRTAHLLAHYAIATPTTSLHEHNEHAKSTALVERLLRGDHIAVVSDAGTPTVSDPGRRLIEAAIAAGIRIEPIPGPSAILAALAVSGFEADSFTFMGFPPARGKARKSWFDRLVASGNVAVFFEAPHRLTLTLNEIGAIAPSARLLVARELTKSHEELVRGPISDVVAGLREPRGEYTVVVKFCDSPKIPESLAPKLPDDAAVATEFASMTNNGGLPRAEALRALSKKYGIPRRSVYSAILRHQKSGV